MLRANTKAELFAIIDSVEKMLAEGVPVEPEQDLSQI